MRDLELATSAVRRSLGGIPARNSRGERLFLFIGIIDILQSYRIGKKLEHAMKSMLHDGVRLPSLLPFLTPSLLPPPPPSLAPSHRHPAELPDRQEAGARDEVDATRRRTSALPPPLPHSIPPTPLPRSLPSTSCRATG